ncbi:MAG: hypothetical protein M1821_000745 [Bathelium mastoideum]|nr:MAG: hypothetical protein M1821_000745 [Bathelium mastoideum]
MMTDEDDNNDHNNDVNDDDNDDKKEDERIYFFDDALIKGTRLSNSAKNSLAWVSEGKLSKIEKKAVEAFTIYGNPQPFFRYIDSFNKRDKLVDWICPHRRSTVNRQSALDTRGTVESRPPPRVVCFPDMMYYHAIAFGFVKSSLDSEEPAQGAGFRHFVRKGAESLQAFDEWRKPQLRLSHFLKWK